MFQTSIKKDYINPYRHGVYIGNFVEDIFGQDLKKKHEVTEQNIKDPKNYLSEMKDKYRYPSLDPKHIKIEKNDLTSGHNSNYDLNIDFTKQTIQQLREQLEREENDKYLLKDKNIFLANQVKSISEHDKLTGANRQEQGIETEIERKLQTFNESDARGLLYTKRSGLSNTLLKEHGSENTRRNKEFSSIYK